MNPKILAIFFHIGSIVQTVKDVEATVADIAGGKSFGSDGEKALADLAALIDSGVISIPGVDGASASKAITDLLAKV